MKDDVRVVLASNRGPISFVKTEAGFDTKRGAGGLSGALDPVARTLGDRAVWIAAATSDTDREALSAGAAEDLREQLGYHVFLIDIPTRMYAQYYDVVSNRMLWFANHCLWDELGIKEFGKEELAAWDAAYEPVNERFAQAIAEVADPTSLVLLQDYHLAAAPRYLRALLPNQTIFHFIHSSFCGPEAGLQRLPRPLPQRTIEGLLGADLIGFHVDPWTHNFLECCERIGADVDWADGFVRHDGRKSWVRSYPIPIDAEEIRQRSADAEAQNWAARFKKAPGDLLLVRADRTEPSKNIVRGFQAYEQLLDRRADLRERVHFVACLYPSRQSMSEYRAYTETIETTVSRINNRYPGAIELFLKDDFDRTIGALLTYDALLVNPIMDGMNLVAKEGPAVNQADGVLVLSQGAGAYAQLGSDAVCIDDPLDIQETSRAIETALDMPAAERGRMAKSLRGLAEGSKPSDWIDAQIADLLEVRDGGRPLTAAAPHPSGR